MAKSKEQKRKEALERLKNRLTERKELGLKPTHSQQREHNALSYLKRKTTDIEKLFGPGDPATGTIYANPLPWDFRPTPELDQIVELLKNSKESFREVQVSLERPEGYPYATYEGGGDWMSQWVARHTSYSFHHSKNLYGLHATVVFCLKDELPCYDENGNLISGTPKEIYERRRYA